MFRGTVFSLPTTGGTSNVLASFNGADGANPQASLILSNSILYGTTSALGGNGNGSGEVFSLPTTGGTPNVVAYFNVTDGAQPEASLDARAARHKNRPDARDIDRVLGKRS